jgi:hypothetical protein
MDRHPTILASPVHLKSFILHFRGFLRPTALASSRIVRRCSTNRLNTSISSVGKQGGLKYRLVTPQLTSNIHRPSIITTISVKEAPLIWVYATRVVCPYNHRELGGIPPYRPTHTPNQSSLSIHPIDLARALELPSPIHSTSGNIYYVYKLMFDTYLPLSINTYAYLV